MKHCMLIILFWLINMDIYGQINHTVTFDAEKLNASTVWIDGNTYSQLEYEDCKVNDSVGYPSLPYKYVRFIVPNGSAGFSIKMNEASEEFISLSDPLLPVRPQVATTLNKTSDFATLNSFDYQMDKNYPEDIVKIVGEGYLDGDKRILTVRVAPVQYKASEDLICFHPSVNFTIHFEEKAARSSTNRMLPIVSVKNKMDIDLMDQLSFIENKSDIDRFVTSSQTRMFSAAFNLPSYEYVVITSESLAPHFKKLIDWKRQKGLNAGIVTMQSILKDPAIVKDEVSNLSDDAGKLRQYLRLAYQNGTRYVLLGGGKSVVPIRYGTDGSTAIPTDLYFSDLNGNWNADGDEYLGEPNEVDYAPEIFAGRILCKNKQEVENYVDKLLIYEQYPGNGNYSYLQNAFYSQADQMQDAKQANKVSERLSDIFPNYIIMEEYPSGSAANPTFPKGKDIIDGMKQMDYGFVSWFNHGSPCGLGAMNNYYNSGWDFWNFIGMEGESCNSIQEEVGNGLSNLVNTKSPSVLYTISCTVVPYDSVVSEIRYNIGESMTIAGKYGSVAFLGNTRDGWVTPSFELENEFISELKLRNGKVGMSEAYSKVNYMGKSYLSHWLALTHNLIGCPEFEMWTNIPSYFTNASVSKSSNAISVNSMVDDTNMVLRGLFSSAQVSLQKGRSATFSNLPKSYVLTLYKHDYLPYIAPVYLQNELVTGRHYLAANRIYMGNHVDGIKTAGDFVIDSGADVTFDVSGDITLDPGTEIKLGATLEIKIK